MTAKFKAPPYGEGDNCPIRGCDGQFRLVHRDGDGCSCNVSAPCSYCTSTAIECHNCGLDAGTAEELWDTFVAVTGVTAAEKCHAEKADAKAAQSRQSIHSAIRHHRVLPGIMAHRPFWLGRE